MSEDLGYCCDDYHQLIASRVGELSRTLGRDVDYIEIGTFTGNSAAAVLATGRVRRAVLIDNFCLPFKGKTQSKKLVEARLSEHIGHFEMMVGDGKDIARKLTETFDVGFVDGDHEKESCFADMTNMWPLIRESGVMFIHDVGNESFTYLLPVVAAFAKDNKLKMALHNVSDGLAELTRI